MRSMTIAALLLASCQTADEVWMTDAKRPIVLTAEDGKGCIILTDADWRTLVCGPGYALSSAIAASYEPGDTLKP